MENEMGRGGMRKYPPLFFGGIMKGKLVINDLGRQRVILYSEIKTPETTSNGKIGKWCAGFFVEKPDKNNTVITDNQYTAPKRSKKEPKIESENPKSNNEESGYHQWK
jgi:hypothetical protein